MNKSKNSHFSPEKKKINYYEENPKLVKSTPESRLSDLEKTLDINVQIIKTFYNTSKNSNTKEESILKAIENINKQSSANKYIRIYLK